MTRDPGNETNINSQKENKKKRPGLTRVKMLKLVTLILRPIYSHKKQIKIDYEAQFPTNPMLNNKIKKKIN